MIGKYLTKVREERRIGVNELSRLSGVNASYISAIENGTKNNPSDVILSKLATALDVSVERITGEAASCLIEDAMERTKMTLEQVATKANVPLDWLKNLDNFIPGEWGNENVVAYKWITQVAYVLGIPGGALRAALAKQEIPAYDGPASSPEEDFEFSNKRDIWAKFDESIDNEKLAKEVKALENVVDKAKKLAPTLDTIPSEFNNPSEARDYINMHEIFGSDGLDVDSLSDDEVLEFANELLRQMQMVSYKYKK